MRQVNAVGMFVEDAVVRLTGSPEGTARRLADVIQAEPMLATAVLREANAACRAARGRITSVERAVVVLGFRAVRDMALRRFRPSPVARAPGFRRSPVPARRIWLT